RLQRFLYTPIAFRGRDTGDLDFYWTPAEGQIVPQPPALKGRPLGAVSPFGNLRDGGAALPVDVAEFLRRNGIRAIATMIPFDGYDAQAARRLAQRSGVPFLQIPSQGLETWDTHHLTERSRELATEALATRLAPLLKKP